MSHALIIDDKSIVGKAVESRLIALGFASFDHASTEAQATFVAACRPPDLVVVGDKSSDGSPFDIARDIARQCEVPILLVSSGQCEIHRDLAQGAIVDGPFPLGDIAAAVAVARGAVAADAPTVER